MENSKIELKPIGTIHTSFQQAEGTPVQPVKGKGTTGWVEVDPEYVDGLKDVDGFERIWLLFWCHRASEYKLHVKPYRDTQIRGLFATRAPSRPNPIGISCVKLIAVNGNRLQIEDVDMLDGTPLLDIKPYTGQFDFFPVTRCGWMDAVSKDAKTKADNRFFQEENE